MFTLSPMERLKCIRCGKTRETGHDWDRCAGKCRICGSSCAVEHDWSDGVCRKCGQWKPVWELTDAQKFKVIDTKIDGKTWSGAQLKWIREAVSGMRNAEILEKILYRDPAGVAARIAIESGKLSETQLGAYLKRPTPEAEQKDAAARMISPTKVGRQQIISVLTDAYAIRYDVWAYRDIISTLFQKINNRDDLTEVAEKAVCENARNIAAKMLDELPPPVNAEAEALKRQYDAAEDTETRTELMERAKGYICKGCDRLVWPKIGIPVSCVCPDCGTENHVLIHVDNIVDYRDYSVGERHDECTRCGVWKNTYRAEW